MERSILLTLTLATLTLWSIAGSPYQKAAPLYALIETIQTRAADDDLPEGTTVEIESLAFKTREIRIAVGDTLTWVNRDAVPHTATADDGSFDTGIIGPGETAQLTFEEAGTFTYYCIPHPFMKATVIVE